MRLVKPSFEILTTVDRQNVLQLIELSGRTCYKSEDRMTPQSSERFCRMVVDRNHLSVIEHVSCSVKFIIDRGVSHELVRHRLCSFSQESTRYCNYGKANCVTFVIPPWAPIVEGEYHSGTDVTTDIGADSWSTWFLAMLQSEKNYLQLLNKGWSPQQARSVLPNSLKTEIVVTTNLREWLHIFKLRCDKAAHPQMREVMVPLQQEFQRVLPVIFGDILTDAKTVQG